MLRSWGPAAPAPQPLPRSEGDAGLELLDRDEPGALGDAAGAAGGGEDAAQEMEEEEEEELGARLAKGRRLPRRGPTLREREEHNLTHLPYRSWCPACVAGRGRGPAHTTAKEDSGEEKPPTVCIDFFYPAAGAGSGGDEGEGGEERAPEGEERAPEGETGEQLEKLPALVLWGGQHEGPGSLTPAQQKRGQ